MAEGLAEGPRVRLQGLSSSQYNGKTGTLGAWSKIKGRYVVTLDEDGKNVRVKPQHFVLLGVEDTTKATTTDPQHLLHTAHLRKLPVFNLDRTNVPHFFPDEALSSRFADAEGYVQVAANGEIVVGCCSLKRSGKGRVGFALLISETMLDLIGLGHDICDKMWAAGSNQNKLLPFLQSVGRDKNKLNAFSAVMTSCMTIFEYSRRFCAGPSSPANELCWIAARKLKSGGWQTVPRFIAKRYVTPSEVEGGNRKCCEGRYGTEENVFQSIPMCEKCAICDQKKREGKGGSCSSDRGPMVWCPTCLITGWCSRKCRKRMKKSHTHICKDISRSLQFLGLSAVCYCCGSSSTSEGVQLKLCRKCKVAKYCSPECQKLDWDRNHRTTCRSYRM